MTPREAWEQLGGQIIADGKAEDCAIILNFLRVATVMTRGAVRHQPNGPPSTIQVNALASPFDGPILEHIHRKLQQYIPALFVAPAQVGAPHMAALMNQTVAEGFEALRADRALEREAAAVAKTFSEVFPASAPGLRRLCQAGNDDALLPPFWTFFSNNKGKKAVGLSSFISDVTTRGKAPDSAGVQPIVSTALWTNISSFELGAIDLETITQGISPFLMCPAGYVKAAATTILTQKYLMLQGENNLPLLQDIQQLVPSNDFSIPDDMYSLADFIGAYSVIWDILLGIHHPLSTSLRLHHRFWTKHVKTVLKAIPESHYQNVVIIGTLRYIQLSVLRYVNEVMFTDELIPVPTFDHIESAVHGRLFQMLPALPASYVKAAKIATLPPPLAYTPVPPKSLFNSETTGNPVTAPSGERIQAFADAFVKAGKTIQQLKMIVTQPKVKKGNGTLCLSYHFRGKCFDSCRRASTHRRLDKVEEENMVAFISNNL